MQCITAMNPMALRWILLAAALALELLGLTARFDSQNLFGSGDFLSGCIARARCLPEILAVVAAALLIGGWNRLRTTATQFLQQATAQRNWPPFALAHLAAFEGLALASTRVFDETPHSQIWPTAWLVLALGTMMFWLCAVAPLRAWLTLVRNERRILSASAVLGILAWSAGRLTQNLWEPLGDATFCAVATLLGQITPHILTSPETRVLGVDGFSVEIASHCSGFEGLGLMAVFLSAFLGMFRDRLRFPHALLLLPIGLGGIWFANVLRIAALVMIGAWWSPEIALSGFHSQAGWIAFNLLALALMTAALRVPFFCHVELISRVGEVTASTGRAGERSNPAAYLVPFLAITAAGMACAALQSGFDLGYPIKIIAAGIALWCFRGSFRRLAWNGSWGAVVAGTAVFALWMALDRTAEAADSQSLPQELSQLTPPWAFLWVVFRVIGSVVLVPLVEELAFRGYLMRRWAGVGFEQISFTRCSWPAVVISSLLFGLLHGRWFAGTLAGLIYAVILRRRGNFGDAVLAHAVTNAQIAALVVFGGAWQLWS